MDPPRAGCPPAVIDRLFGELKPPAVVYVSCNPEALARELPSILDNGYGVRRVQPVDMFPHTTHLETVVSLAHVGTVTAALVQRPAMLRDTCPSQSRPAATVVVIRPRPAAQVDVLLVRRNDKVAFMAGAYVFPGGRVDESDKTCGGARPRVSRDGEPIAIHQSL